MRRTRDMLRSAAALTPADWRVLCRSVLALARTDAQITLLPYPTWRERVAHAMQEVDPRVRWTAEAQRHARVFGIAVRCYPRRTTCLTRALSFHALLAAAQIPTKLCIGVRRPGAAALEGHAWLEQRGVVVYDHPGIDDPHLPLAATPPVSRRRPAPDHPPRPHRR